MTATVLLRCGGSADAAASAAGCAALMEPTAESVERARELAAASGWSHEGDVDWCGWHTSIRARVVAARTPAPETTQTALTDAEEREDPMTGYQLFDALPQHIEDALRASIRRFGVLVPIVRDQHGRIIDGHHRVRIADEEGIGIADDVIIRVKDDDEAREIAATLNADRRQLTEDQRRAVVADLRQEGHSVRAIAGALGVGKSTVARDLSGVPRGTPEPERAKGLDGKSYPARRPDPPPAPSAPEPGTWHGGPDPTGLPAGQDRADAAVAAIDQRTPAPAAETDPAPDPARQDKAYLAKFTKALVRADEFMEFDPERLARVAPDLVVTTLGEHLARVEEFMARARATTASPSFTTG